MALLLANEPVVDAEPHRTPPPALAATSVANGDARLAHQMDTTRVMDTCRCLPGATEGYPFGGGVLVFKVGGRIFAILSETSVSLKCDPGLATVLREQYPAVRAGYHLNKRHWNTVELDGSIDDDILAEWIEDSYDLALRSLTRAQRRALGA
jgi:predicted DNA-binding protein (MmcQ/YjbR family)